MQTMHIHEYLLFFMHFAIEYLLEEHDVHESSFCKEKLQAQEWLRKMTLTSG